MLLFMISAIVLFASVLSVQLPPCATILCQAGTQCVNGGCMCGENMEFNACGSACPAKCGVKSPDACIALCVAGCFCKQGFILSNDSSTCIPESECDTCETEKCVRGQCVDGKCQCGENMEFNECGSYCPAKCGVAPVPCIALCSSGCFCKEGFILSKDGSKCISTSECRSTRTAPAMCGLNEVFKECGLATEPTCENPNPRFFTLRCINTNVCQCNDGLLRNSNGSCVQPMECVQ